MNKNVKMFTKKKLIIRNRAQLLVRLPMLTLAVLALAVMTVYPSVRADRFDEEINALRQQNNQKQSTVNELASQASTYQEAISALQSQINGLQAQIDANTAKQNDLQRQIEEAQAELARQRSVLGEAIKTSYLDGQITTIEILATSKNLSDFVDKEEYHSAVETKIQATLKKITALQTELKNKKAEIEALLRDQKAQQSSLDAKRSEQSRLLSLNQEQQAAYSNEIKENNNKINDLKKQQALENARRYGSSGGIAGGGGYPWGNAYCIHTGSVSGPCSNYDWAFNGSIWNYSTGGYGYRNCTDWVAWRVGNVPSGLGNANTWANRASQSQYGGYSVNSTPRAGDAAVDESGGYGHVMYVESADSDSITVSDYNRIGDGLYRVTVMTKVSEGAYRSPTGYVTHLRFVHF